MKRYLYILLGIVLLASAIGVVFRMASVSGEKNGDGSDTAGEVYDVQGQLLAVDLLKKEASIAHEAIPGYMPAMVMAFSVKDSVVFQNLEVGEAYAFEFVVEESTAFARNFEPIDKEELDLPDSVRESRKSKRDQIARVEEGDEVPGETLTNQEGNPVKLSSGNGAHTLMTFIFTRCPVPDFCPLMSQRFQEIQGYLKNEGISSEELRLLSVTLDPEFDTPEVLKDYGNGLDADFSYWEFATAELETIENIATAFRVYREKDGTQLDHSLCTALISPEGEILQIWRGNRWEVQDVQERINTALERDVAL